MSLNTSLPNAATARQQVDQGAYNKAQKQLQHIEGLIVDAIGSGCYCVSVDYCLEPPVKSLLINKGYSVSSSNYRNENSTSIAW